MDGACERVMMKLEIGQGIGMSEPFTHFEIGQFVRFKIKHSRVHRRMNANSRVPDITYKEILRSDLFEVIGKKDNHARPGEYWVTLKSVFREGEELYFEGIMTSQLELATSPNLADEGKNEDDQDSKPTPIYG